MMEKKGRIDWSRLPFLKAALIALIIGWLPLLVYIPFDWLRGGGGNPIGPGLLMLLGTGIAALLSIVQGLSSLLRRLGSGGA